MLTAPWLVLSFVSSFNSKMLLQMHSFRRFLPNVSFSCLNFVMLAVAETFSFSFLFGLIPPFFEGSWAHQYICGVMARAGLDVIQSGWAGHWGSNGFFAFIFICFIYSQQHYGCSNRIEKHWNSLVNTHYLAKKKSWSLVGPCDAQRISEVTRTSDEYPRVKFFTRVLLGVKFYTHIHTRW